MRLFFCYFGEKLITFDKKTSLSKTYIHVKF